jgi:hypothetical protein
MRDSATHRKHPGPSVRASVVVIAVGIALAVPSGIQIALPFVRTISSKAVATPGVAHVRLERGGYTIFERTGTTAGGGGFTVTRNNAVSIDPSQVSVTAAGGGDRLVVKPATGVTERITRGSEIFTGAIRFRVDARGDYEVRVDTSRPGDVLVARSFGDTLHSVLGWVGAALGGAAIGLAGITMLIIGSVRRRRGGRSVHVPSPGTSLPVASSPDRLAPTGWYPDPEQPARLRYWDGTCWTDHFQ